jgi:hypothetical protein
MARVNPSRREKQAGEPLFPEIRRLRFFDRLRRDAGSAEEPV